MSAIRLSWMVTHMPLLRSLGVVGGRFYKHVAPLELKSTLPVSDALVLQHHDAKPTTRF
jgi:hypothetical protein